MKKTKKTKTKKLWLVLWREGTGVEWRIDSGPLFGNYPLLDRREATIYAREESEASGYEHIAVSVEVPR